MPPASGLDPTRIPTSIPESFRIVEVGASWPAGPSRPACSWTAGLLPCSTEHWTIREGRRMEGREAKDRLYEQFARAELVERAARGEVVILDVRPTEEFVAGHIPGALSIPLDQLEAALARLPKRARIVAYCRGPYCVLAPQVVQRLRAKGFTARRLVDGMPEWRLAGLPVAAGKE